MGGNGKVSWGLWDQRAFWGIAAQDSRPGLFSVVPAGLVGFGFRNPGLRPGLLPVVPAGLGFVASSGLVIPGEDGCVV